MSTINPMAKRKETHNDLQSTTKKTTNYWGTDKSGRTQPILCHMLNCKTKQKYNDKSLRWYKVWLVTDTNIVVEIIKKHVGTYFYFRYRKKNKQQKRQPDKVLFIGKLMSHVFKVSILCDI